MTRLTRILLAMAAMAITTGEIQAQPFDALRWRHRLLLVFADAADPRLRAQTADVQGRETRERALLVIPVPSTGTVAVGGLPPVEAEAVRRAYGIDAAAPFTALLVGKDGGVKMRSDGPIAARDLYDTIDAMPMRANETKAR